MYIKSHRCDDFVTIKTVTWVPNSYDSEDLPMPADSTKDNTYTHQIDADESPSHAVVRAVSAFSDTPITELDPLYLTVDPEAMDCVLETTANGHVSFQYNEFDVTVSAEEIILEEA